VSLDELTERDAAADHEAGHLLARFLTGDRVARAVIADNGSGTTFQDCRVAQPFVAAGRCLAGPIAEAMLGGRRLLDVFQEGCCEVDLASARSALAADPGGRSLADAGRATERLLRRHEAALFEVAMGLAIHGALDGAEVAEIMAAFPARQAAG
jgi:hypothetical protein